MIIKKLVLENFHVIMVEMFLICKGLNIILGENGEGKQND